MKKESKGRTVSDLVAEITVEMERLDYKRSVVAQYHIIWDKLCKFAGDMPADSFTIQFGMNFLEDVLHMRSNPLTEATTQRWMKTIYLLGDFNRTGIISMRKKKREFTFIGAADSSFKLYIAYLVSIERSDAHIRDVSLYLERFSIYLNHMGLLRLSDLSVAYVNGYVNSLAVYELPTIYHALCAIRGVLRFLHHEGIIQRDLSLEVPNIKYRKKAKIPSVYSKEEIERMISSIDRDNPRGKRDYALILLAARLGLRALDIAELTFSSFKWDRNSIELVQHKTGRTVVLPLLADVGDAVIDYIRFARPKSESQFVFLKLNAPNDVMYANSIHHTVYTRLKSAGIHIPPGKKHGPHALRHSLASALLEDNIPLPVISETLGHSDTESTSIYTKIDLNRLKECALEIPDFCEWNLGLEGVL
jgi:site-specific recombinase XerD